MVKVPSTTPWREARRRSARDNIVEAAWGLVREEGLAGLSLRDLARRAGITTPTVYAYFDSKNAIYDAMFGEAARQFLDEMSRPYGSDDPRAVMAESVERFFGFCLGETARYQLLFQRTLPGFEPSPESYEPAIEALTGAQRMLALNGITKPEHLDLWTALLTGLVDQQVANDPGGDRWLRLVDEAIDMFLAHCAPSSPSVTRRSRSSTPRTTRSTRTEGVRS
jgi:AcrR family transcriptional regulator